MTHRAYLRGRNVLPNHLVPNLRRLLSQARKRRRSKPPHSRHLDRIRLVPCALPDPLFIHGQVERVRIRRQFRQRPNAKAARKGGNAREPVVEQEAVDDATAGDAAGGQDGSGGAVR